MYMQNVMYMQMKVTPLVRIIIVSLKKYNLFLFSLEFRIFVT